MWPVDMHHRAKSLEVNIVPAKYSRRLGRRFVYCSMIAL